MDVSVVIATYNRVESLRKTYGSLRGMTVPANLSWELIIVDNNSSDGTKKAIGEFEAEARLPVKCMFEANQGKAHAINAAIQVARGDIIAVTDDDCIVDPQWLVEIKTAFDRFECIAVGGRIVPVWTVTKPDWLDLDGPFKLMAAIVEFDCGDVSKLTDISPFGANMAFRRSAFQKYGGFRTDLGPGGSGRIRIGGGGDDTEFFRRLLYHGEKVAYSADAIVYHPVEKQRTEKKYFESWYFNYGKSLVRKSGIPKNSVHYLGVPRYLIRKLTMQIPSWFFSVGSRKRFYHKLQVYQSFGEVCEAYRVRRQRLRRFLVCR